ncbi:BREX-1 system adenine-specific DNA-methyltransferase PglX [Clostridium tertium]
MDKNILKSFAIEARKELIEKIKVKARQYGIEKDSIKNSNIISSDSIVINGTPLSKDEKLQREKLIKKIEDINENGGDGYSSVIEEVAYTWFNRFTALRFMEVNNYMPTRVRPLSSTIPGNVEPELIKEASNVDLKVDKQKIYKMKLNNDMEALFKYMIIAQCNSLNTILPFMFEEIGHYTELLLPDGLLNEGAFIRKLTDTDVIPESDWEDVEIIGWLYQYYNSEEKDRVIKAKKKYTKEEIPFATQLFTPDWIVRYMVQNSLGRYWVESHPEHDELKKEWEFYLENPNPEPDFEEKLAPYINKELKVEDIKCFDPACGSGHILVYMFDVLYQIYEKCGYMNREIPRIIIENNLYGLDIDDRAYQLACFAVIMKGMKYNNRLLRSIEREGIKINIASIQETNNINDIDIEYIAGEPSGEKYNKVKVFIEQFKDAKIYGSLIKVDGFDKEFLEQRCEYISNNPVEHIEYQASKNKQIDELLEKLIKQANIMVKTYNVLVTNPPYIGNVNLNDSLSSFIDKEYPTVRYDIFAVFMKYSFNKVSKDGQLGFMTPYVWMFTSSYEELRKEIICNRDISSLVQLEYSGFDGATVPICTFTLRNSKSEISGEYIKLSDFKGVNKQAIKTIEAIKNSSVYYRYNIKSDKFREVKGWPIAFWITDKLRKAFNINKPLNEFTKLGQGLKTGDNNRFIRGWYEVDYTNIKCNCMNREESENSTPKWYPYANGGGFRKWYGNIVDIVNWQYDGNEIRNFYDENGKLRSRLQNMNKYFKEGITWSAVTSSKLSLRYVPNGIIYGGAGYGIYADNDKLKYLLGLLNSMVPEKCISILSETLNFEVGNLSRIPIVLDNIYEIDCIVDENIKISKKDWDSYELSLDFSKNPLIKGYKKLDEAYYEWIKECKEDSLKLKENEKRLNEIFINIYGLKDELSPEVKDENITLIKNLKYRYKKKKVKENNYNNELQYLENEYDENEMEKFMKKDTIKELISYFVGCLFGRYSLDKDGLIFAGGKFDFSQYKMFKADEDNIIPILSDDYFEDDIVAKFTEFVKITFGEESLSENLDFIAETLGKKNNETSKDTIRRYFLNDFFKDHVQTYKNRPIYWLFTSGKQKAFNCLVYMHRYDKTTLSRIRTDYLHELQDRLDTERKSLTHVIDGDYSSKEKNDAKKKLTTIDKQIDELKKYDEVLHHMADMQIEINLDNGVVENYKEFKGLVSKI